MTVIGAMLTEWLITILLMASSLWRDDQCQLVDDGWASTVGPYPSYTGEWRYPWADVLWARQNGYAARGGITDDTRLHIEPVAMHQAMHDHSWLGRSIYIENVATGRFEPAVVIDAMASDATIVDLTPAQITSLNGGTFRPGLRVRVWTCDPQQ